MPKTDGFGALLEVEMSNKCTQLGRKAHVPVKMYKTPRSHTTFGSRDVEKVHAVAARSTCPSQKCQKLTVSDHFWKVGCQKSARRCGAKHISKSEWSNTTCSDHFWASRCQKSAREADVEVESVKKLWVFTLF